MTQGGRPILEALTWVVADDMEGLRHDATEPPDVEGPDGLTSLDDLLPADAPRHVFFSNLEERPIDWVPVDEWETRPPGEPLLRTWYRTRPRDTFDDPFADAGRLAVLVDTFQWPAATRAYAPGSLTHIAPSLDLAVSFHHLAPTEPWLLVEARAPLAADGLVGGTATVWAPGGVLLASGGQQMLCRPAPPPPG